MKCLLQLFSSELYKQMDMVNMVVKPSIINGISIDVAENVGFRLVHYISAEYDIRIGLMQENEGTEVSN